MCDSVPGRCAGYRSTIRRIRHTHQNQWFFIGTQIARELEYDRQHDQAAAADEWGDIDEDLEAMEVRCVALNHARLRFTYIFLRACLQTRNQTDVARQGYYLHCRHRGCLLSMAILHAATSTVTAPFGATAYVSRLQRS